MKQSRFMDPLYGPVYYNAFEEQIIFSPELQRLRHVRMCNINSLLITGASQISRFEHVIGVLHLAQLWSKTNVLSTVDCKIVCAAALLHDTQTGPFGHSMEYILGENEVDGNFIHEDLEGSAKHSFFQDISASAAFKGERFRAATIVGQIWPKIAAAIKGEGKYGHLISAAIDIDNIDNVCRLAYHVGLIERSEARSLCESLTSDLKILNGQTTFSHEGLDKVIRWQEVRKSLYLLLLHDWAEFAAKAMLTKVMEEAVRLGLLGVDHWILTDDQLLNYLEVTSVGEGQPIKELLQRLQTGNLYHPVLLARVDGASRYDNISSAARKREIEIQLSRVLGGRCIFHPIKDKAKTERAIEVFDRSAGRLVTIGSSSDETLIGIFASRLEPKVVAKAEVKAIVAGLLQVSLKEIEDIADPVELYAEPQDITQYGLF
jgi:HD superfamily phosphohydrolase